ncbi:hypothetical protein EUX98_g1951 [Antrodiella citrinella]|uniref:Uncharacterized protein n=1 Tax=Antrodiella citrinella TaxID=2447956 RepID=A0A4S4N342_9APHY|nr:hypothetical protein EUX98_g1951 [Antrodiella citrinella]
MADSFYQDSHADAVYLTRVDDAYSLDTPDSSYKPFDSTQFGQTDIIPHHVELFEDDIDNLAFGDPSFDNEVLNLPQPLDSVDIFSIMRSETPTHSALSKFTLSSASESAYDSGYNEAASAYTHNTPSQYSTSNYIVSPSSQYMPNPALVEIDLAMEGLGLRPAGGSAYGGLQTPSIEHSSPLNTFPPTPSTPFNSRALSEYGTSSIQVHVPSSSASDYQPGRLSPVRQSTVSPANVSPPAQAVQGPTPVASPQTNTTPLKLEGSSPDEPERRFACPSCPRC